MAIISKNGDDDYERKHQEQLQKSQKYGKEWEKSFQNPSETAYPGTDEQPLTKIVVTDGSDAINYIFQRIAELEAKVKTLQEEHKQRKFDNLFKQNDVSRKELESIFGIEPNGDVDTASLDGLLEDFVDPEQNSQEMVRSVRDN